MKISELTAFLGKVQSIAGDVAVELPALAGDDDAANLTADLTLTASGSPNGSSVKVSYNQPAAAATVDQAQATNSIPGPTEAG